MAVQVIKGLWVAFWAALALVGCSGEQLNDPNAQLPQAAGLTALQIAQNLYDNAPRTPLNFYQEQPRDPQFFYAVNHLKNSHVDAAVAGNPSLPDFELCANDMLEASIIEQNFRQTGSPISQLLSSAVTDQYFEFEVDVPNSTEQRQVVRIFDCNFVDRSTVNLRAPNGEGGTLNERPLAEAPVRFLAEYSFLFSPYNNVGYQVLSSEHQTTSGNATQTLLIAELVPAGSGERCDHLTIFAVSYSAGLTDGRVEVREITEWSINTERVAGLAQSCS
jgi:hypothetical protein